MRLIDQPEVAKFMSHHPRLNAIINQLNRQPAQSIHIALGELFPLTKDQLRLQWDELTKDTGLAHAELTIRVIRAEHQCMVCFEKYHPENKETTCPHCGSVGAKVLAGEEFYMESLEG